LLVEVDRDQLLAEQVAQILDGRSFTDARFADLYSIRTNTFPAVTDALDKKTQVFASSKHFPPFILASKAGIVLRWAVTFRAHFKSRMKMLNAYPGRTLLPIRQQH
jgi:hypothetical protein